MKILISLILTLITFNGIFSQKAKRKEITLPIISYPSDLPVKNITSYFIDVLNEEGESSGLTSDQLQKSIALLLIVKTLIFQYLLKVFQKKTLIYPQQKIKL